MNMERFLECRHDKFGNKRYKLSIITQTYANEYYSNSIKDIIELMEDSIKEYNYHVSVYDRKFDGLIYFKRVLSYEPEVDMIFTSDRDLRTTTNKIKK